MKRLWLRLISRATPAAHREWVVGDTLEELGHIEASQGPTAARRWLRREAWRSVRHAAARRLAAHLPRGPGAREQQKKVRRDVRGWGWLEDVASDARFALRAFRKAPLFSLTVVASLALGIGVTTAVFSAVNAMLLRALPYPNPSRLVWVEHEGRRLNDTTVVFGVQFEDWRQHARSLEDVAAITFFSPTLTGIGDPVRLDGLRVSPSFFSMLGASLVSGRGFLPEEDQPGREPIAVVSYGFWQGRLGGDPNVVGRSLRLDDGDVRVVGVLAAGFRPFMANADVWRPLVIDPATVRGPRHVWMHVIARLKAGVERKTAEAELQSIKNVHGAGNETILDGRVRMVPLQNHLVGESRRLLLVLFGAVSLTLLIACSNVANLLLARGIARQKERAILAALGAARSRLVRQMLTESLVLASAAGALGLALALALVRLSMGLSPPGTFGPIEHVATIDLDARVLVFTIAASLLSALVFGFVPALRFSRPDLVRSLKEGGGRGGSTRHRTRSVLLVAQVALAMVLLVGTGLLLRSLVTLLGVDPGYRASGVLTFRIGLPKAGYPDHVDRSRFQQQLLQRLRAVGGVQKVGAATNVPLTGAGDLFVGNDELKSHWVRVGLCSPGYFAAMGIALRRGRDFDERDTSAVPPVLIVTESLARRVFPGEDPLGKTLPTQILKERATIVGVVEDHARGPQRERRPELYLPFQQHWNMPVMTVAVRSILDPAVLMPSLRGLVHALDSRLLVEDVMTMSERLATSVAPRRFVLTMLGLLATVALVLAAGGVYGTIAYIVAQRTHEVGIRRALGARASDVVRLFVGQGMRLGLCGMTLGLVAAIALSRATTSLLFGITPTDPLTFASVPLLFTGVVWIACWLPARRATRVAPVVALRRE